MTEPGTILIVDDDRAFVEMYQEILEDDGYLVATAHTEAEAVHKLEHDGLRTDVVLLDQKLGGPGGRDTGLDLIRRIADLAPFSKVLVVTGYAAPEAVERAFAQGVYDYLDKTGPFKALLRAKVRNAVEVASERRRAALERDAVASELTPIWAKVRIETDPARKGRLLEELVKLLFRATKGFEYVTTRVSSDIEEIDIVVENRSDDPLWKNEGAQYLLGECKNWSKPCERKEFDSFYMKLTRRYQRARTGFFIAPGGFTEGFHEARKRAKNGYVVVPVGPEDMERWVRADDRAAVLRDLHARAVFDED